MIKIIIPTSSIIGWFEHCISCIKINTKDIEYRIVACIANEGFARSVNKELKNAGEEYICLLNDDTEAQEGWLRWLIYRMESDSKIGIVGSKLIYPLNGVIQHAGIGYDYEKNEPIHYGRGQKDSEKYSVSRDIFAVSFASVLIRKRMINEIGLLDERYRYFFEDMDYCIRARQDGWRVVFEPDSKVIHYESVTIKENKLLGEYEISKETFLNKWRKVLSSKR